MEVIVENPNTILIEVDQGRQGRGITNIAYQQQGQSYFLVFTFTDGTTQTIGPLVITGAAYALLGGTTGAIPYQTAPDTTGFLTIGSQNQVLVAGATTPQYTSSLTDLAINNSTIGDSVRATGAFTDITGDSIQFNTLATEANAVGKLRWDAAQGTVDLGLLGGNVISRLGESIVAYVTNAEATTISKGQVVYLFGAQGDRATVKLANNTGDATSAKTLGVAAENITSGQAGFVMCQGVLDGLSLNAYQPGDTLYLGATPGSLTANKPSAPNHLVYIGVVERTNPGSSQLYVRTQNGYELEELHDVQIVTPANGQTILYDAATSLWKNANLTAGSGIGITNGTGSVTIANTGVLSFSGGSTGLTPSTATTGAVQLSGTLAVASGGTNASNAGDARTNLGAAASAITISAGTGLTGGGNLTANRTLSIADTAVTPATYGGASKTLSATVNQQGQLTALSETAIAIANTQVSGLGTMSTQAANNVSITGGSISGITDLAIADGGTGASNAGDARSNLGLGSAATLTAGAANGVATLDGGGKVPLTQIPASLQGGVSYQGSWNAATNTPTLASGVGSKGYYYVVSVGGSTNIDGITDWLPGDWIIFNGNVWEQIDNTDSVASVNNYTGVVVLAASDVGAPPTSRTISAGTGLSGGGDLTTNRTLSIADTTVTAGAYGGASKTLSATVNAQGQLTALSEASIAIANTQVSGLGTMSTQAANNVAITGGSINGTTIGGSTTAAGAFTTLSASSDLTLSGGTANGVLYLNGSKVATSGSALVFDGANLGLGVTPSAWAGSTALQVGSSGVMESRSTSNALFGSNYYWDGSSNRYRSTAAAATLSISGSEFRFFNAPSGTAGNAISFTQAMTLDASGNLGIGVTSPSFLAGSGLQVYRTAGSTVRIQDATTDFDILSYDGAANLTNRSNGALVFGTNNTERARITSGGEFVVGTTAAAGSSQITAYGATNGQIAVQNSTNWSRILQNSNDLYIDNGVGGSAGNIIFRNSSSTVERARIDASGNLGLGVTPSTWTGSFKVIQLPDSGVFGTQGQSINVLTNATFNTGWKYVSSAYATLYSQTAGQHQWYTAPSGTAGDAISFTQALTLDANANLLLNGTLAPTSGVGTFAIFNGAAPTGSVTNGIVLYAEDVSSSSELKVRDEAGNVTTLSPHNFSLIPEGPSEELAWAYYSERDGKRINVDMLKLARMVEKLSGEQLVFQE